MECALDSSVSAMAMRANMCLNGRTAPVKTAIVGPGRIETLDALKLIAIQKLAPERCVDPIRVKLYRVKLYSSVLACGVL